MTRQWINEPRAPVSTYLNVVVTNVGGCVLQLLGREPAASADNPEETSTYDVD